MINCFLNGHKNHHWHCGWSINRHINLTTKIVKIIKEKKAQAISPIMFFVLLAGNGLWVWYGLLLQEWPIIITNAFSVVCDLLMIALNYKYAKK